MTVGVVYLFIVVPAIALIAGGLAVRGTRQSAERVRAIEAERREAAGTT